MLLVVFGKLVAYLKALGIHLILVEVIIKFGV